MQQDLDQNRREAHALLDALPADKLNVIKNLLEVLTEPLARSLALAEVEEEELTTDTAAALERARTSLVAGEGIDHEDVLREFGIRS